MITIGIVIVSVAAAVALAAWIRWAVPPVAAAYRIGLAMGLMRRDARRR